MAAENHLLRTLEPAALKLLKPQMKTITVHHGELLHSPSSQMEFAYFPISMIISVLARTSEGQTAETSIVRPGRHDRLIRDPWNHDVIC